MKNTRGASWAHFCLHTKELKNVSIQSAFAFFLLFLPSFLLNLSLKKQVIPGPQCEKNKTPLFSFSADANLMSLGKKSVGLALDLPQMLFLS